MTRIDLDARKAKKEEARTNQYPRTTRMQATEVAAAAKRSLSDLSYRELQAMAKELGLKSSGSAEVLRERIAAV